MGTSAGISESLLLSREACLLVSAVQALGVPVALHPVLSLLFHLQKVTSRHQPSPAGPQPSPSLLEAASAPSTHTLNVGLALTALSSRLAVLSSRPLQALMCTLPVPGSIIVSRKRRRESRRGTEDKVRVPGGTFQT